MIRYEAMPPTTDELSATNAYELNTAMSTVFVVPIGANLANTALLATTQRRDPEMQQF